MTRKFGEKTIFCDFCGKDSNEAGNLIESSVVSKNRRNNTKSYVCGHCIQICSGLIENEKLKDEVIDEHIKIPSPKDLVKHLDQYIVGQTRAKQALAVATVNHYKRLRDSKRVFDSSDPLSDVVIDKSNILMMGPTGCGKTLLARTLAKTLKVPFAIGDATTITEAGYVGEDVENLLLKLIRAADFDIEFAQKGIIYIDEIDKIGRSGGNVSITRDVSGEGVQQSLLKMLEGTIANVPPNGGRKHPESNYIEIDTTNILFIVGGTFVGLDDIISRRLGKKSIGFHEQQVIISEEQEKDELLNQVISEDLVEFGLIPELIGRLPVITPLQNLNVASLVKVLTEPKDALVKQYQKIFRYDNCTLEFTSKAVEEIAKLAIERGTGARGLKGVIEDFMLPVMLELPEHTGESYLIDEKMVLGSPIYSSKKVKAA